MNAVRTAPHPFAPRANTQSILTLQRRSDEHVAGAQSQKSGKLAALVVLLTLSFSMLCLAGGLSHIYEDKSIPAKVRTKIAKPINEFAFGLCLLSVIQAMCGIALVVHGQQAPQSKEVSEAFDDSSVSRIINKRETLSTEQLLEMVREMSLELKQAKTFQRYLIEKASHVACVMNAQGIVLTVSKASLSAWGYPNHELEGQCICDYVEDAPAVFSKLMSIAGTNRKVVVESRLIARDGELLDIVWTAYWSKSDQALFCIAQDFTEQNRQERERREFIAMVTHDLRTPISSLRGIVELLNHGVLGSLDEKGKQLCGNVSRDFGRLERLINDMLEVERAESAALDCKTVCIGEIASQAADILRVQAQSQDITINIDGPWLNVWADQDQLMRVFINLLSNAVKFSPDSSVVDVHIIDADDVVRIGVVDCGPGVPADRLERIFDKFERAKLTAAKRAGGTGLGLAICKAIVRNHSGEIGVNSREGCGSEFWFTVPKERPQSSSGSQPAVGTVTPKSLTTV